MKINLNQLEPTLKQQGLAPIYVLSGDDPILQQDALNLIVDKAASLGFHDKKTFNVSSNFDSPELYLETQNLDLFSAKKILLVRFNSAKLNATASQSFLDWLKLSHPDILLIVQMPKLDADQAKSKWHKTVEEKGQLVLLWPLNDKAFETWLKQRILALNLKIDAQGIAHLKQAFDGNLLAAHNALQGLALAYSQEPISEAELLSFITPEGHYPLFQLTDEILQGHPRKVARILTQLQKQGVEATLILWALLRELRLLCLLSHTPPIPDASLAPYRLWPQRKMALQSASHRLETKQWKTLFKMAELCDKMIKGQEKGDPFWILHHLSLRMALPKNTQALDSEFQVLGAF